MLTRLAGAFVALTFIAGSPGSGAAAPKGYVGLFKDNAVAVLDTKENRVTGTIPVPPGPHGLVVTPDGRKVYVSSDGASTVSVIDTATDRVVGSIEVGANPHGLAMSPDGRQVLVSGFGTNQAVIIDTATDRVVGHIAVPQPHNAAIAPDGRRAYVASQIQGAMALVAVDLTSQTVVGRVPLDKTPRALDWSPDGTRVYFTVAGAAALQVLDPTTNQVVAQIPVGASPHFAPFTADGRMALAVAQGPGELQLVDPARNTVTSVVAVGKTPHWVASTSDGRLAYVTNESSNDVSVVDLATRRVLATVAVGNAPRKVAVLPGPSGSAAAPQAAAAPGQVAGTAGSPFKLGAVTFADHGTRDVRGLARVEVEADDYYFAPTFLRGSPGQHLTLVVENESGTLHSITIPALHVDRDVPPKGKVEVEVTFPASGVVHLFCRFHEGLGMNGELLPGDIAPQPVATHP
jgi:YVTN family beta-propeller protein